MVERLATLLSYTVRTVKASIKIYNARRTLEEGRARPHGECIKCKLIKVLVNVINFLQVY